MPRLLAIAEEITKLLAICVRCGNPAVHTQRLVESDELVVVGGGGAYEARCRRCFEPNPAHARSETRAHLTFRPRAPASSAEFTRRSANRWEPTAILLSKPFQKQ